MKNKKQYFLFEPEKYPDLICPRCKKNVSALTLYPYRVAKIMGYGKLCYACDKEVRQSKINALEYLYQQNPKFFDFLI